jgi:hypothetical protein
MPAAPLIGAVAGGVASAAGASAGIASAIGGIASAGASMIGSKKSSKNSVSGATGAPGSASGGGTGFDYGYWPEWKEDYENQFNRWNKQRDELYNRAKSTGDTQMQRTIEVLDNLYQTVLPLYDPNQYEQRYASEVEGARGLLTALENQELDPYYAALYKQKMDQVKREYQRGINQLLNEQGNARARGDVSQVFRPERQDEAIARMMQEKNDKMGDEARAEIENTIMKLFKGQSSLLGEWNTLGQQQRARDVGAYNAYATNLTGKSDAMTGYENMLNDILNKFALTEPDPYAIKAGYRWQTSGTSGTPGATNPYSQLANLAGPVSNLFKGMTMDPYTNVGYQANALMQNAGIGSQQANMLAEQTADFGYDGYQATMNGLNSNSNYSNTSNYSTYGGGGSDWSTSNWFLGV